MNTLGPKVSRYTFPSFVYHTALEDSLWKPLPCQKKAVQKVTKAKKKNEYETGIENGRRCERGENANRGRKRMIFVSIGVNGEITSLRTPLSGFWKTFRPKSAEEAQKKLKERPNESNFAVCAVRR